MSSAVWTIQSNPESTLSSVLQTFSLLSELRGHLYPQISEYVFVTGMEAGAGVGLIPCFSVTEPVYFKTR